jgi:hypothetical protein
MVAAAAPKRAIFRHLVEAHLPQRRRVHVQRRRGTAGGVLDVMDVTGAEREPPAILVDSDGIRTVDAKQYLGDGTGNDCDRTPAARVVMKPGVLGGDQQINQISTCSSSSRRT